MNHEIDEVRRWLLAHENTFDLATVWVMLVCMFSLFLVDTILVLVLAGQRSRTDVGRTLKGKKLAEAVLFLAFAVLFGVSLWLYYAAPAVPVNVWYRIGVRILLNASAIGAVVYGVRLIVALAVEHWGGSVFRRGSRITNREYNTTEE